MELFAVGTRVRATYPNRRWGAGVVVSADAHATTTNPRGRVTRRKPYVVLRDDGTRGFFHTDQVELACVTCDDRGCEFCPAAKEEN